MGTVNILDQTPCVHQRIHCPRFLRRIVLGLLMDPSAYQSPLYNLNSRATELCENCQIQTLYLSITVLSRVHLK